MRNEEWSSFELRLGGYVTSQALIQAVLRLGGAIPDRQDGPRVNRLHLVGYSGELPGRVPRVI